MNKNFLSPVGFQFSILKLPEFNFFVQSIQLPGIELGSTEQPTPFKAIPIYGDHVVYGDISVNFAINEDLGNYIEIFNWIRDIGFPDSFEQHKRVANADTGYGIYSDANLTILSSAMNPNIRIQIEDLFPISLSPLSFDTQDSTIEYLKADCIFKFRNYSFLDI